MATKKQVQLKNDPAVIEHRGRFNLGRRSSFSRKRILWVVECVDPVHYPIPRKSFDVYWHLRQLDPKNKTESLGFLLGLYRCEVEALNFQIIYEIAYNEFNNDLGISFLEITSTDPDNPLTITDLPIHELIKHAKNAGSVKGSTKKTESGYETSHGEWIKDPKSAGSILRHRYPMKDPRTLERAFIAYAQAVHGETFKAVSDATGFEQRSSVEKIIALMKKIYAKELKKIKKGEPR